MITLEASEFNPSQLRWLESQASYSLMCAGVGSGKSTAGRAKIMLLKGANGHLPGLVIAQTYGALFTNIVDPLMELYEQVPVSHRPKLRSSGKMGPRLVFPDGCVVYLRSAEIPKGYDGLTVAWLYGDEIKDWSWKAYLVAIERVRIKAAPMSQRAFTSTPRWNWMNDEWNTEKKNREVIRCGTAENAHNLPDDYIENLKLTYSPRLQKAMLLGKFSIMAGAVFEEFDPDPAESEWFVDFDPVDNKKDRKYLDSHKVMMAVDPGFRRSAYLWIVEHPGNDERPSSWTVFDQYTPDNTTDVGDVEVINQREWPVDEIWVDPAAGATQSYEGTDTLTALSHVRPREHGARILRSTRAFRSIPFGIDKLRILLGGYEDMPRRLKFAHRVARQERGRPRGTVKDLGALRYEEVKDGRPVTDKPLKDGLTDHTTDALRYWAVGRWMTDPELRKRLARSTRAA